MQLFSDSDVESLWMFNQFRCDSDVVDAADSAWLFCRSTKGPGKGALEMGMAKLVEDAWACTGDLCEDFLTR